MKNFAKTLAWLPQMYFIQGLPNAICTSVAIVFYTMLGVGVGKTAVITSVIYLPWVLKALWAPFVDSYSTKAKWVKSFAIVLSSLFLILALSPFFDSWVIISMACFWTLAFASATYDIAADGYYMLALDEESQAFFVGIRSSFYRLAVIFGQGGLLILCSFFIKKLHIADKIAWSLSFAICAALVLILSLLMFVFMPKTTADKNIKCESIKSVFKSFYKTYKSFFEKKHIVYILLFILFYRFAEAQLVKVAQPFLIAEKSVGGLALDIGQLGVAYGTCGAISLLFGGILGGIWIAKKGLKSQLWLMAMFMNVPNILYLLMSHFLPENFYMISFFVAFEQFGYGFGFASYMTFMIVVSAGENRTSQYAILTAFMALGFMLPGFFAGYTQEFLGYYGFFIWLMIATSVSFAATYCAHKALR